MDLVLNQISPRVKFFSFSVFESSTSTNSIGLKSSANAPTSLVGGGEKLSTEPVIFKGTNVSTNQAYGVNGLI